jgi:hypothetical protein
MRHDNHKFYGRLILPLLSELCSLYDKTKPFFGLFFIGSPYAVERCRGEASEPDASELSNLPVRQLPIIFGSSCACIAFMRERNMAIYPRMPLKINALDATAVS